MIRVTVETKNNKYKRITSFGHADFDDYGKDLVCCAVSILVVNTANSIEKFTDSFERSGSESGFVEIVLKDNPSSEAIVLVDALLLGLEGIIKQYGADYLSLEFKEV